MSQCSSHIKVFHGSTWQSGVTDQYPVEFGLAEIIGGHRTRAERWSCVVEAAYNFEYNESDHDDKEIEYMRV